MIARSQHAAVATAAQDIASKIPAPVRTRSLLNKPSDRAKTLKRELSKVCRIALRDAQLSSARVAKVTRKQAQHVRRWCSEHERGAPTFIDGVLAPIEVTLPLTAWLLHKRPDVLDALRGVGLCDVSEVAASRGLRDGPDERACERGCIAESGAEQLELVFYKPGAR